MYLILSFYDQLIYVLQITSKTGEYYVLTAFVKPEPLFCVIIDYMKMTRGTNLMQQLWFVIINYL